MHAFHKWLSENENNLPKLSVNLFKDSLKCFFNEIERPAYLLAYQGVMAYVRDVLMKSDKPFGYADAEWVKTLKNTQNEDSWDAAVFDLIKKGPTVSGGTVTKAAPLNIPDSVRIQFDYWRTQRNVCAHYKADPFLRAHVEAFYGFISHWLLKISGKGGMATMIAKLEDFCNPSKTPDNADINPVIDAIPQYVSPGEYTEFLKNGIKVFAHAYRRNPIEFVISILGRNHGHFANIRSVMLAIIRSKDRLRGWLLENDARYVLDLYETPDEIRTFWYDEIHDLWSNRLNVLAVLLEAGKIPEDQKEEAFNRILSKLKSNDRGLGDTTDDAIGVLLKNGYFDQFVRTYLIPEEMNSPYTSQLSQWCYQTNFFIEHLGRTNMSKDLIDRLMVCFGSGKKIPYTIQARLRDDLWKDNQYHFKDRFLQTAKENGMSIPENWIK